MPKLQPRKGVKLLQTARPILPRVSKDYEPSHCYSDGEGGVWTHRGLSRECTKLECVQWHREQEPPRPEEPYRGPAGENCPKFGAHQWVWGDDQNGHSGDVCECGAYQPG